METRKILSIIFSVLFLGVFAFVLAWGITNFNKVQDAMSGTQIYDANDLNNAYNDGYSKALENKDEYDDLINTYRDNITSLNDTISQLNSEKTGLQNNILDYQNQVNGLNNIKAQNETLVANLRNQIEDNSSIIQTLNNQNNNLSNQISVLNATISDKETQIEILDNRIANYQTQIEGLQQDGTDNLTRIEELNAEISSLRYARNTLIREKETLQSNVEDLTNEVETLSTQMSNLQQINISHQTTINTLNNQIISLNYQISYMSNELQQKSDLIFSLNARITELQNSIMFYDTYIDTLETDNQAYAIFEYNGSIHSIQVVNKDSIVSIADPEETDFCVFNGWMVNGEHIDLSTYPISTNIRFIADTIPKHKVTFIYDVDNVVYQYVVDGSCITLPEEPQVEGQIFEYWITEDTLMNITDTPITKDTKLIPCYTPIMYNVDFVVNDEVLYNYSLSYNASIPLVPYSNTEDTYFEGWYINDEKFNPYTYRVTEDVTLTARFSEITVETIDAGDKTFVRQNMFSDGNTILLSVPTGSFGMRSGYIFNSETQSWRTTSLSTFPSNYRYTNAWTDGVNYYYSAGTQHYRYSQTGHSFSKYTFRDYRTFNGESIFNAGDDTYLITGDTMFVLDTTTIEWTRLEIMEDNLPVSDHYCWTDGTNLYYHDKFFSDKNYVFNKSISAWVETDIEIPRWFDMAYVWSDGQNTYYSQGVYQYVFDTETHTWVEKNWTGFSNFNGCDVIMCGGKAYYISPTKMYILNTD